MLGVLASLGLLGGLLHLPASRELVRSVLVDRVSRATGARVSLESLAYRLWLGEATLEGASLEWPGLTVAAERVEARLSSLGSIEVEVTAPVVRLLGSETGESAEASPGGARFRWPTLGWLARARVTGGRLELQRGADDPWLALLGIGLETQRTDTAQDVRVTVTDGSVTLRDGHTRLGPLTAEAELEMTPAALRIHGLRVREGGSRVDAHGSLEQPSPLSATAEADFDLDAGGLGPALGLPAVGRLSGDARLGATGGNPSGDARLEARELELAGLGPFAGRLVVELGEETAVTAPSLEAWRGRLDLKARLGPRGGHVAVSRGAFDVTALVEDAAGVALPLSTRATADAGLELNGWDLADSRGQARLQLEPGSGPGLALGGVVEVTFEGGALVLRSDDLRAHGARASVRARLSREQGLEGRFRLEIGDLERIGELLGSLGLPPPPVELTGSLALEGGFEGSDVEARLAGNAQGPLGPRFDLSGQVALRNDALQLTTLELRSGDGFGRIDGSIPLGNPRQPWDVAATLDELALDSSGELAGLLEGARLDGRLFVRGAGRERTWGGELEATLPGLSASGEPPGVLALSLVQQGPRLEARYFALSLSGGRFEGAGEVELESGALRVKAQGGGARIGALSPAFSTGGALDGVLGIEADLSGSVSAPVGTLRVVVESAELAGAGLGLVRGDATSDGETASFQLAADDTALLEGRLDWADRDLVARVDLAALPTGALLPSLFPGGDPPALTLTGSAELRVPGLDPAALRYSARVETLVARRDARELSAGAFRIDGDRQALSVDGLELRTRAGRFSVEGRVALEPRAPLDLRLAGDVELEALRPFLPFEDATGQLQLEATVSGSPDAPLATGELRVAGGGGRVGGLVVHGLDGLLRSRGDEVRVDRLRGDLLGGSFEASGALPLPGAGSGSPGGGLDFALTGIDLVPLVSTGEPASARARVDLRGRLGLSSGELTGAGLLTGLTLAAGERRAELAEPVSWRLESGRFGHDPLRLRGDGTDLRLAFTAPSGEKRWRLETRGTLESALARWLLPAGAPRPSGRLDLDLDVASAAEGIALEGEASLRDARLVVPALSLNVASVNGALRLHSGTLALGPLEGRVGSGALAAEGTLSLEGLGDPGTSLRLVARQVPLTQIEGVRARATAELRLEGQGERALLSGQVELAGANVTRELDAAERSLDALDRQLAQLEAEPSFEEQIGLDVQLQTRQDAQLRNSLAELDVAGTLRLTGTLAAYQLGGSLSVRAGGRLRVGRALVRLDSGRVDLAGYPAAALQVELSGHARVSGIAMELRVSGNLDDLDVQLSSRERTDLTQGDLATLLMTGRTASAAADEGGAIVAEELAAALGGALQDQLGGDFFVDVSADQAFTFDDTDPATRFSVGKPLGQGLAVAYSTALDGTSRRWLVSYEPGGGSLRLRSIAEPDGSWSLDATHRTSFGLGKGRDTSPAPEIRSVSIVGSGVEKDSELLGLIRSRTGKHFEDWRAGEDAERIRDRLMERGFPTAVVEVEANEANGGLELVYGVDTGPRVEIVWSGDDPGQRFRDRIEASWPAGSPIDVAPESLARGATLDLQAEGFYLARVEALVERSEQGARVGFRVTRGPRGRGVQLVLEGARALDEGELRSSLPPAGSRELFEGLAEGGSRLRLALRAVYARKGFLAAGIDVPRIDWLASEARLRVTVPIDEGERASLVRLELPPEAADAAERGALDLALAAGRPFDLDAYVSDRGSLAAFYRSLGYPEARVAARIEPVDGSAVAVVFSVDPGPRVRVGRIRVAEGARTREDVVANALLIREGDLMHPAALAGSRRRLTDNRVMRSAELRPVATADPEVRDLVVDLIERPVLELAYGVRYTTSGSGEVGDAPSARLGGTAQLSGQLELLNPAGRLHRYNTYAFLGFDRQLFGAGFEAPFVFGRQLLTQVFLFQDQKAEKEIEELDASRVRTFSVQQTRRWRDDLDLRRWNDALRLQWGYAFDRIRLTPRAGFAEEIDANRGSVSASLVGDSRDSFTNPSRGLFWSVTPRLTHQLLGSDVDFVSLYGQLFAFVPLGDRVVWASGYRLGAIPGSDPSLLLQDRFRAGGPNTVRGIAQDGLGPRLPSGTAVGGQAMLIVNQELRFPIWKKLAGGVYWDTGQVFETAADLDLGELRHSAGAGLRVMLPFGPVRLDWARLLDPQPGEPRTRFWFTIGHAF